MVCLCSHLLRVQADALLGAQQRRLDRGVGHRRLVVLAAAVVAVLALALLVGLLLLGDAAVLVGALPWAVRMATPSTPSASPRRKATEASCSTARTAP